MKTMIIPLFLLLAGTSQAREYRFAKKVMAHELQNKLVAAGFAVQHITCAANDCRLIMPDSETKDPAPVIKAYVFVDPLVLRQTQRATMMPLVKKVKSGTATAEERDRLLWMLVEYVLGSE